MNKSTPTHGIKWDLETPSCTVNSSSVSVCEMNRPASLLSIVTR